MKEHFQKYVGILVNKYTYFPIPEQFPRVADQIPQQLTEIPLFKLALID
ncbi:hypothetical protein NSP_29370 [Nodularia spumigena CCY9414]|nr:hypothetical protein NSP_29370 [Nodularia spumigena CCY9414]